MNKTLIAVMSAIAFAIPAASFAYTLPAKTVVTTQLDAGKGTVDFTKSSSMEGTVSIDNTNGEDVWLTAGSVSDGHAGYGFYIHNDKLSVVSNDGYSQIIYQIGYVHPGVTLNLKATYTVGDGIRYTTSSNSSSWNQYSRSIVQKILPYGRYENVSNFDASVISKLNPTHLTIGTWQYN